MARLTLEVSEDFDALLRDLARAEKIDKYEVIRRALALYQYVHQEAVEQKHKLKITDEGSSRNSCFGRSPAWTGRRAPRVDSRFGPGQERDHVAADRDRVC